MTAAMTQVPVLTAIMLVACKSWRKSEEAHLHSINIFSSSNFFFLFFAMFLSFSAYI